MRLRFDDEDRIACAEAFRVRTPTGTKVPVRTAVLEDLDDPGSAVIEVADRLTMGAEGLAADLRIPKVIVAEKLAAEAAVRYHRQVAALVEQPPDLRRWNAPDGRRGGWPCFRRW